MRLQLGSGGVRGVVVGCCVGALVACQSPGSVRIVGPDGSAMAHVHCGSEQGVCFRIAGELCPTGYDMKPVLSGNDGNFLVRCRAAATPVVATAPAAVRLSVAPPPAPRVAEGRAATQSPPSLPIAPGDVDIGY